MVLYKNGTPAQNIFPSLTHIYIKCKLLGSAVFADNSVTNHQVIFTLPVKIHTS
jgi:hypothetical protein